MSDWFNKVRDRYQGAMAVPQTDMATAAFGKADPLRLARVLAGIKPQEPPQVQPMEFGPQPPPLVQSGDIPPPTMPPVTVQASPYPAPGPNPTAPPAMDVQSVLPMPPPQQIGPVAGFDPNDPRYLPEQWRGAFNPRWQG